MKTLNVLRVRPFPWKGIVFVFMGTIGIGLVALGGFLRPTEPRAKPSPAPTPAILPTDQGTDPALPPIATIFNLGNLTVPRDQILRGRQPKDGIKSLTNPRTSPTATASFLKPDDRVVGVTVDGMSCAYPIAVLNWHEVINDHLSQTDLAITYCSLCDSVTVVDRQLDGKTYEFGLSCLIYQSNMLLYDRTDQALWSQLTSSAISGPQAGRALRQIESWELTTFGAWRAAHPGSTVVSFETGYQNPYDSNPHRGYFATDELDARFQSLPIDTRLRHKARIIGVKSGETVRAYPIDVLEKAGQTTVRDRIGGEAVELAIDAASGTVRVEHAPKAALVVHTFWFAWVARFPETEVYRPSADDSYQEDRN